MVVIHTKTMKIDLYEMISRDSYTLNKNELKSKF
jgi:hypothetical protein